MSFPQNRRHFLTWLDEQNANWAKIFINTIYNIGRLFLEVSPPSN